MCAFAMAADAMMMIILNLDEWMELCKTANFWGEKKRRFYIFLEFYEKELSHTIEN